jgi:hypothetical protein
MSFNTVVDAANDIDLQQRVTASIHSEAISNVDLKDTQFAAQVKGGYAPPFTSLYWAVANAVHAAYEAGQASGRGSPGHDQDVVTDGAITSAVVANWPPDPPPPPVINPGGTP